MSATLKNVLFTGLIWSMVQKFGAMLISFASNLVLARILTPDDYGMIGMLLIFISISNTFIDGGFGTALVQKKNPTSDDYSTIFYWNIIVSVLLTGLLYVTSPYISSFYGLPLLSDILRVMGFILIINAFGVIQSNILQKNMQFKKMAIINLIANAVSSIIAIIMALYGYGVWSLVARALINAVLISLALWVTTQWKPILSFKIEAFKSLGKFGGMILLSNLVETMYTEIQGLVIGKVFSAKTLGYYTQAKRLEEIPTLGLSSAINQSSFPVYAKFQDDKYFLTTLVRKYIKVLSFVVIPAYTILILIANPLIHTLFTAKWASSVEIFQILCFIGMIYPLNTINVNVIKSLGRGKLYFNLQFFKRLLGIIVIVYFSQYGLRSMLWASVFTAYTVFFINAFFLHRLIDYKFGTQVKDVAVPLLICMALLCTINYLGLFSDVFLLEAIMKSLLFALLYYLILRVVGNNIIHDILHLFKS